MLLLFPVLRDTVERGVPVCAAVIEPSGDAAYERLSSVVAMLQNVGCEASIAKLGATVNAVSVRRV